MLVCSLIVLLSAVAERFTFFLHESVAKARIRRLFDVIVEFPDSKPALEDLRECMEKVSCGYRLFLK